MNFTIPPQDHASGTNAKIHFTGLNFPNEKALRANLKRSCLIPILRLSCQLRLEKENAIFKL